MAHQNFKVFTPPDEVFKGTFSGVDVPPKTIFLAGSIEMGKAEDWQSKMVESLSEFNCQVFNPRRVLPPTDTQDIKIQINWELDHLQLADIVFMQLCAFTISPISLLELGVVRTQMEKKPIKGINRLL